jgi:hypothetical protein
MVMAIPPTIAACAPPNHTSLLPPNAQGTLRIVSSLPSKGIYAAGTKAVRHAIDAALSDLGSGAGVRLENFALEGGSDETGDWTAAVE